MLSFASVALTGSGEHLGTFSANLFEISGAVQHPETMKWWNEHQESYSKTRTNCRTADVVMPEYADWIGALPGTPVFVGYPATYDFMFVYWYLMRYAGKSPFGHFALDIRTYAMAVLRTEYLKAKISNFPEEWLSFTKLSHVASEDALAQGMLFIRMKTANAAG